MHDVHTHKPNTVIFKAEWLENMKNSSKSDDDECFSAFFT